MEDICGANDYDSEGVQVCRLTKIRVSSTIRLRFVFDSVLSFIKGQALSFESERGSSLRVEDRLEREKLQRRQKREGLQEMHLTTED